MGHIIRDDPSGDGKAQCLQSGVIDGYKPHHKVGKATRCSCSGGGGGGGRLYPVFLRCSPTAFPRARLLVVYLSLFFGFWIVLHIYPLSRTPNSSTYRDDVDSAATSTTLLQSPPATLPTCPGDTARFYIYDLPGEFNDELLRRCRDLSPYTDMCPHVANRGLGRPIPHPVLQAPTTTTDTSTATTAATISWYATHQFIAEMIFHARAERHPCRTFDPDTATLFYVPFYAGLYASSVFREPEHGARDRLAVALEDYLLNNPNWQRNHGRDHFMAVGRTAWDFMRDDQSPEDDFGANRLFLLPSVRNMTILTVEHQPWSGRRNQRGIPYASYFHPSTVAELSAWQALAEGSRRTHLYAFVGGARPSGLEKAAVRGEILRQCAASPRCIRSQCEPGSSTCHEPSKVLGVMMAAEFCMQPPGDSFTRRSVFDAVLAGCIPVFFSEHTAYTQYEWYVPTEETSQWSVFVPKEKWGDIEGVLAAVPKEEVIRLRRKVLGLIPSFTYAHPNASGHGFRDAVDVALARLTAHVAAAAVE